jgi:hypothetical protein
MGIRQMADGRRQKENKIWAEKGVIKLSPDLV